MRKINPIYRNELLKWNEINIIKRSDNEYLFEDNKIWFAYSRQALAFGLSILGIGEGDSVLVPEYICNVIESPFIEKKIKIKYYKILADFTPDYNNIEYILEKSDKALLYINYFGFPADHENIQKFCKQHNLLSIEDNAHGFLSKYKGNHLGGFGDISITSVYKKLPLIHGAYLQLNCNYDQCKLPVYLEKETFSKYLYRYFRKYVYREIINSLPVFKFELGNSELMHPDKKMQIRMSKSIKYFLGHFNIENYIVNRKNKCKGIIEYISNEFNDDIELLYTSIPESVVPLQIPLKMPDNQKSRELIIKKLLEDKVEVFYWPDLPRSIVSNKAKYNIANYYKENYIHFPTT